MRLPRRRLSRTTTLNALTVLGVAFAAVLAYGYIQSEVETRWTTCDVDTQPRKLKTVGTKHWSSKTLFCEKYTVVIAIRHDQPLPKTPEAVLEKNAYVSCSYDVARNPFHLFPDQVIRDTVDCHDPHADNDVG